LTLADKIGGAPTTSKKRGTFEGKRMGRAQSGCEREGVELRACHCGFQSRIGGVRI